MKKEVSSRSKKGFTLVELMAVIGVIGVLMAVVLVGASSSRKTANISTTAQQIQLIYSACQSWLGNGRTAYTGISLNALQAAGYLPATLNNPYGGTYTVAVNATDATQVDVSPTKIPDQATHDEIASALSSITKSAAYTASSKTSKFTF
ncbi:MAG TPA: type II secretion system protein [Candidatus Ratteibacteria bacterium]|nr:type II secretion system protein [Candidatus Ratteibacteria bacterium]